MKIALKGKKTLSVVHALHISNLTNYGDLFVDYDLADIADKECEERDEIYTLSQHAAFSVPLFMRALIAMDLDDEGSYTQHCLSAIHTICFNMLRQEPDGLSFCAMSMSAIHNNMWKIILYARHEGLEVCFDEDKEFALINHDTETSAFYKGLFSK